MMTTTAARLAPAPERSIGLTGGVALTWALAGGVALGGFAVALLTLTQRISANGLLLTSSIFFVLGTVAGFGHGAVLGYFGRPEGVSGRRARIAVAMAALYTVPALAVGWLVSGWIAMTTVALYLGRWAGLLAVGVAWAVGVGLVAGAAVIGARALRNAYARWPEARLGTTLVAAGFGALLVTFLAERPVIWGIRLQVTEGGAVVLAALLALWVIGPVVTIGLRLLARLPAPAPVLAVPRGWRAAIGIGLALAVGVVLGLLAVPFHAVPAATLEEGAAGAVVLALGKAIVDEVLLRLFVLTAVVWLLLRWHAVSREGAAVAAVIAAALVQVALYLPGVIATGFPTTLTAAAYVLTGVLLPGLAFGALYWRRGLAAALVADAAAVIVLALAG